MTSSMALQSGASSSLSVTSRWAYDVFLSFRGEDVRNNFVSHLYAALRLKGINTYIDDKLERGERISPALLKAIEGSRISIIILSKNYASSTWCLDELKKILEYKETKQQIVLPVFYKVDPSVVRKQKESYGEALANYEHKFKDDMTVERWKAALKEVANLSGFHLEKDGNESKFIHKIIQWVDSRIINRTDLKVANYPIGIESRLQHISSLLCMEKKDIVHKVGIFGVGGIGKTTIARAIYNKISSQFEGSCFLKNIRETSKTEHGQVQLQEKLLSDILGASRCCNIDFVDRGTNVIKERLHTKKVLLILDDVDEWEQLKFLVGDCDWFGLGSRIIITTRDQNLLANHEVEATYELERFNHEEAFKLFSLCAFKKKEPPENYVELTKRIIDYVGGLPLALEVLGSDLHGRSIQEWESALDEYKRSPHEKIQKILRVSFDGLRESEKNIFLDIACFFKGYDKDRVIKILDSRGFCPNIGVKKLMDKCLITIDYWGRFEMHDLLQDMGREIIREESPTEPGRRSRLYSHEDICHVLEENTGTGRIEGMLIDLPKEDLICLSSEALMKMKNLKYFINRNARFSGGPNYLSNELIVLDWPGYPSQSLPSNFHGKKLVDLRISNGLIKELGVGLQNFQKLTRMDFDCCEFLTKIPDLSRTPNLERLDVADCHNLVEVDASVGSLNKLEHFSFIRCTNLTSLPRSLKFRHLKCLCAEGCLNLQNFPEIEFERECLRKLSFAYTDIKELPLSVGHLSGLEGLDLRGCKNLVHLPTGILRFRHLKTLSLTGSSKLVFVPNILNDDCCSIDLPKLECLGLQKCHLPDPDILMSLNRYFALHHLDLSGSDIIRLPESLNQFVELRTLDLRNCKNLQQIPALPLRIAMVDATGCMSLESFPDELELPQLFTSQPRDIGWIKLYGWHKNPMNTERYFRENPSSCEAHIENLSEGIIFPGNAIPNLFSHRKQNSNNPAPYKLSHWYGVCKEDRSSCRITINGQKILEKIRGILICVILQPIQKAYLSGGTYLCFTTGWNVAQEDRAERHYVDLWDSGDHVWLHYAILDDEKWSSNAAIHDHLNPLNLQVKVFSEQRQVIFKSCGVHLVFRNEKAGENRPGFLHSMGRRVADIRYLESTSYQHNRDSSTFSIEFEFCGLSSPSPPIRLRTRVRRSIGGQEGGPAKKQKSSRSWRK